MGNALNAELTGRHVVLSAENLKPEYQAVEQRVFLVGGGFGASSFTIGTAVFGESPIDHDSFRVEGYDIERWATAEEIRAAGGAPTDRDIAAGVV